MLLAPDQSDGQAPAQLAPGGLVPDAAVEAGSQHVQLGFAHRAFEAEHEAVVEVGRVVEPVAVADEGVGHPAQVQQSIPVGVVAGQAGDFQAQHDAHMAQGDIGGEAGETTPGGHPRPRQAEVLVDHDDRLPCPAQLDRPFHQGVLAVGRLPVAFQLRRSRLANVDHGVAAQMRRLGLLTHRRSSLVRKATGSGLRFVAGAGSRPPRPAGADRRPGGSPASRTGAANPSGPAKAHRRVRCARTGHRAGR